MIDKISEMSLYLDFYSGLLTEKQREILTYYYEEDMSLGEIAEILETSRQAVHDLIKRSEKILKNYEEELGLVNRFLIQREKLSEIRKLLIDFGMDEKISKAIDLIDEIIEM